MELPVQLRPGRFWIEYTADANETSACITLTCSPTASADVLEIGAKHVFACRGKLSYLSFLRKRRLRRLSLTIERQSDLTAEMIEMLSLSKSKIGRMWFEPPKRRDKSGPRCPTDLGAKVWIDDGLHESLRNLLQAQKKSTWLRLSLGIEDDALQYGPGRDGYRMVWKLVNENEESSLDVSSISFDLYSGGSSLRALLLRLGV